jgi:hypothetical protein
MVEHMEMFVANPVTQKPFDTQEDGIKGSATIVTSPIVVA